MVKFEHSTNKAVIDLKNWLLERVNVIETKHAGPLIVKIKTPSKTHMIAASGISPPSRLPTTAILNNNPIMTNTVVNGRISVGSQIVSNNGSNASRL